MDTPGPPVRTCFHWTKIDNILNPVLSSSPEDLTPMDHIPPLNPPISTENSAEDHKISEFALHMPKFQTNTFGK